MTLRKIGRYQVLGSLAVGGTAEVFLARVEGPHGFQRPVVVKVPHPHLSREPGLAKLLVEEALISANLNHPNVVQVLDLGVDGHDFFLVMEYLEGETVTGLCRRLSRKGLQIPFGLSAYIAAATCGGLHAAHELTDEDGKPQKLVHRDVSPQNIFVTYTGSVKLLDFGIAKLQERSSHTKTGQLKGKLAYFSPEQCVAGNLDRRSDIFSLGIVLYELTTLKRLFVGSDFSILKAISEQPIRPPSEVISNPYPPELERIVMRSLARDPRDRYQTAEEMRIDLQNFVVSQKLQKFPADLLANTMRELFRDRIADKKAMISQVKAGLSALSAIPGADGSDSGQRTQSDLLGTDGRVTSSVSIMSRETGALQTGQRSKAATYVPVFISLLALIAGVAAFLVVSVGNNSSTQPAPKHKVEKETPRKKRSDTVLPLRRTIGADGDAGVGQVRDSMALSSVDVTVDAEMSGEDDSRTDQIQRADKRRRVRKNTYTRRWRKPVKKTKSKTSPGSKDGTKETPADQTSEKRSSNSSPRKTRERSPAVDLIEDERAPLVGPLD